MPLSAQVQARLEGVCLQLDTFATVEGEAEDVEAQAERQRQAVGTTGLATPAATSNRSASSNSGSALHMRCALLVRNIEVRDSFQPRRGGGAGSAAAAAAAATGWAGLRRMLGYHAQVHRVRVPKSSMAQLVVEAVRSEPGPGEQPCASCAGPGFGDCALARYVKGWAEGVGAQQSSLADWKGCAPLWGRIPQ